MYRGKKKMGKKKDGCEKTDEDKNGYGRTVQANPMQMRAVGRLLPPVNTGRKDTSTCTIQTR